MTKRKAAEVAKTALAQAQQSEQQAQAEATPPPKKLERRAGAEESG